MHEHKQEFDLENEVHVILLNFEVKTDQQIPARKSEFRFD